MEPGPRRPHAKTAKPSPKERYQYVIKTQDKPRLLVSSWFQGVVRMSIAESKNPSRVFVAVFDGLRPDLVRPDLTPNILRVAARGEWFRKARSVFPPVTRVATTSIATGAPPATHGVVGNTFYFPEILRDERMERALDGRFVVVAAQDRGAERRGLVHALWYLAGRMRTQLRVSTSGIG